MGRSTDAPPGPDGAPYAVNFRAATPISWQYLHLRVLTLGGLTAPPAVVDGALTHAFVDAAFERLIDIASCRVKAAAPASSAQTSTARILFGIGRHYRV